MRKFLGIVLVLLLLTIVVNDTWRYSSAKQTLEGTSDSLAEWAANNARRLSREQTGAQLVSIAAPANVAVYQYGQSESSAQIWTSIEVPSTLVASTVVNLLAGEQFTKATTMPYVLKSYREAVLK